MNAAELLTAYARARRHMGTATWSALLALATEPERWHSRRDMMAKMPWITGHTDNSAWWQSMLVPAIDIGAVDFRKGVKGRTPEGKRMPTRYRITRHGLALLGFDAELDEKN